ncbi:MAG: excinuclease ABC subunit C [Calditrichaeota bacterium]|nr:excinuclease ABC subunit C [Calditrichota bacterium]
MQPTLKEKLEALPDHPGVYLFKDGSGNIIYVGKAKSLRARVRSYFTARDDGRYQYPRLVAAIRDLDIILTINEVAALRTEAGLIRLHQPRYNVDLRDDRSFPFIKITREEFPRVLLTRKPKDPPPGDVYGPYTDVKGTRFLLRNLKGILQIRDCYLPLASAKISRGKFKLCLDYHIGRCNGPCEAKVDAEQYARGVRRFIQFLSGRNEEVVADLEVEMRRFAGDLRFEEAALARDRLAAARQFSERQRKVDPEPVDIDAIGLVREDNYAAVSVIKVRNGRIVGQSPFHLERTADLTAGELLENFLVRHYEQADHLPDGIFLPEDLPDEETVIIYLNELAGHRVALRVPKRGEKRDLLETAQANAEHLLLERRIMSEKRDFIPRAIKALQDILRLSTPPLWVEAFDVSHLHGVDSVASLVVFKDGKPHKSDYRLFKIKSFEGVDDCAAIGEAVKRRYKRLLETENKQTPDLILIDGGLGQLNRAKQVLTELGRADLPVIGLAKRLEEIYIPGDNLPVGLPKSSSSLRLLQQVRDEAHRFAVTKHRLLRGKRQVKSRLDDIPGVGPARRMQLLKTFGSLKRIAEASIDELAAVKGMNKNTAQRIVDELKVRKLES